MKVISNVTFIQTIELPFAGMQQHDEEEDDDNDNEATVDQNEIHCDDVLNPAKKTKETAPFAGKRHKGGGRRAR
jgi:hypothetical protein